MILVAVAAAAAAASEVGGGVEIEGFLLRVMLGVLALHRLSSLALPLAGGTTTPGGSERDLDWPAMELDSDQSCLPRGDNHHHHTVVERHNVQWLRAEPQRYRPFIKQPPVMKTGFLRAHTHTVGWMDGWMDGWNDGR